MKSLSTVCMMLGPYRNFTTLTASVLSLHPQISVLNHAGERVFGNQEIDFTKDFTPQKLDAFCDFALEATKGGKKGSYGGSITHSGAFNQNIKIKDKYTNLYEDGKFHEVKCLLWKESHRLLYHLKKNNFDFAKVFETNQSLRFLIPVRNIYECACSNFITGHFTINHTGIRNDPSYVSGTMGERKKVISSSYVQSKILHIIDMFLANLKFLHQLHNRHPGRFLFYFQHEQPKQIFTNILEFLMLGPDNQSIHSLFEIRPDKYPLDATMRMTILTKIDDYFPNDPAIRHNISQVFENS